MDASVTQHPAIKIPPDVQTKFPELLDLILTSESMTNDERQYWVNVLPLMKPEQLSSLKRILRNEREELKAIEEYYGKKLATDANAANAKKFGKARSEKRVQRQSKENEAETTESATEAEILRKIAAESDV